MIIEDQGLRVVIAHGHDRDHQAVGAISLHGHHVHAAIERLGLLHDGVIGRQAGVVHGSESGRRGSEEYGSQGCDVQETTTVHGANRFLIATSLQGL